MTGRDELGARATFFILGMAARAHPEAAMAFAKEKMRIVNLDAWTAKRYLERRARYFEKLMETSNGE